MKQFLVRQKFRMDLGQWIFPIIQLVLLCIAAGNNLSYFLKLPIWLVVLTLVPMALFGIWFVGYVMDRYEVMQAYNRELNKRNELLQELKEAHER